MLHSVQHGGEEKATHLAVLRKALRDPQTQLIFTKYGLCFQYISASNTFLNDFDGLNMILVNISTPQVIIIHVTVRIWCRD